MNIIVVRTDGTFYTRPDTTLSRVPRDFYVPDDISQITAATCTYVNIIKAGKAVPERFVYRYFDAVGKGILFYCDGLPHIDWCSYFFQNTTPASYILPEQMRCISKEIERITRHISVRFGDIVAFENSGPMEFRRGDTVDFYPSAEGEGSLAFKIF